MFWLRNEKNNFLLRTLIWGPADISSRARGRPLDKSVLSKSVFLFLDQNICCGSDLGPHCLPLYLHIVLSLIILAKYAGDYLSKWHFYTGTPLECGRITRCSIERWYNVVPVFSP